MCEIEGVCEVEGVCDDVCEVEGVLYEEEEECSPAHVYVYEENTDLMQGVAEEQEVVTELMIPGNKHKNIVICVIIFQH